MQQQRVHTEEVRGENAVGLGAQEFSPARPFTARRGVDLGLLSGLTTPCWPQADNRGDGDAELRFRVEVDVPAATPGLAVRCTHSPLWPQPGDNVTIAVESLDGTAVLTITGYRNSWWGGCTSFPNALGAAAD